MRVTSTAKTYCLLILVVGALATGMLYLMMYQQHLGMIIGGCAIGLVGCWILYVSFAPIFTSVAERASDIMAIYPDASGPGLHIFSDFTSSRWKVGLPPLRTIQYYFLNTDTRKMYYTVLFTHSMESLSGSSGYDGYTSFEEDVLGGEDYKKAIEKYSEKAGWPLKLGNPSREGDDKSYETKMGNDTFRVESVKGVIQDTLKIRCYEEGKLQWSKKL